MNTTVKQVLETKGHQVWSIPSNKTVYDALEMMAAKETGALLVVDGGKLVGILSERDYARKVVLKGFSSLKIMVRDIMTTKVPYVTTENTVEECMALMTESLCRHLPVIENDQLIGVLSIGDLVKATISQQKFHIHQLENYITGDFTSR
ncbi:MAG: CBS domain-containing protein [Desulfuromonadales bacterium]|nr:CBS domain-containing protein [Desulfuromonadales bacterium]